MTGLKNWLVTESGLLTSCGFARTAANCTKQCVHTFHKAKCNGALTSHHTVQSQFSWPFCSSLPSLEQHLLLFSYGIMFKYESGAEDLDRHCYSLVWVFLSEPVMILIMTIMTMYLTYCEREVKCVSLSIIQNFIFLSKFLNRFHSPTSFLNMVSEDNHMTSMHYNS